MSLSSTPTTTMLWASCATVDASAPERRPKPRTKPRPMRPVPWWRSMTAIFARSRPGSDTAWPSTTVGSSISSSVTTWSSTSPMTRARPPLHGIAKSPAEIGCTCTVRFTHSGTCASGMSVDGAARLEHRSRLEGLEVVEHDEIGLVAGRDRAEVVEAVPGGRVQRGEDERVLGRDSRRDGLPHHLVQVTGVGDVLGVAVVRAERHARRAELLARAAGGPRGSAPSTPRG